MDDRRLLFFVKNPGQGAVKTRLASAVGEEVARSLYRSFILDMLSTIQKKSFPLTICFHPEDALGDLKKILGENHRYLPQRGDDLGQKMEHCFRNAFSREFQRVIAIGSDVPDLPAEIVGKAFRFLTVVDSVIGPSFDGGYYLIGFRSNSFVPEVFRGIEWGTDMVLKETTDILRRYNLSTHLLPTWRDIDTVEDLGQFLEKNKDMSNCPRTMAYLDNTKLLSTQHST